MLCVLYRIGLYAQQARWWLRCPAIIISFQSPAGDARSGKVKTWHTASPSKSTDMSKQRDLDGI